MTSSALPIESHDHAGSTRLSEQARAQILGFQPTALLVSDSSGCIRYVNLRASQILGVPIDRLVGEKIDAVLAPIDELIRTVAVAERDDLRASIQIAVDGDSPRELGIQLTALPPEIAGAGAAAIVFQDIDHYQRLHTERDRLLKLATVGEVLPSILHELKNPLASVTTAVELLVEEADPGPLRDDLHAILIEVRRMRLGFDGIGVVSRDLTARSYNAIDFALRNTVQILKARAQRGGIILRCDVPDLPLLPLDPSVVRAIAFNLLNNALHACRDGEEVRLSAGLEEDGSVFVFEVSDGGTGMNEETLRSCTELFFTTKNSGSGIGLALCKSTVKAASGTIEISSELGTGTTASVRVPLPCDKKNEGTGGER